MAGFLLRWTTMSGLKIIGRIVLILLMIPAVLQLALTAMAIVAVANQKPDAISYLLGQFVGTLLFLMLFIVLFKKLGKTCAAGTRAEHDNYQATGAHTPKSSKIILR